MNDAGKARWFQVCEQITREVDHAKFESLLAELNKLLDEEEAERGDKTQPELKWHKTGWGCSVCGWHIAGTDASAAPSVDIKRGFESHPCKGHPRKPASFGKSAA
jgi:hypothetical protein